ncbi:hypothetical protein UFOVP29_263 [uncultured Caudovirales phage]|uniref:Uncharacterized protein n=1 Tax=uncultured Caudovirales phage TaxID=2100421 RepID=A0A6J5KLG0_9CAUD|nr:hypothetical protein UFOVP29_263 [uncultured Caudovirales phage]
MAKLSLWRGLGTKTKDYQFTDKIIAQQYQVGGVEFYVHKYMGPDLAASTNSSLSLDMSGDDPFGMTIQDVVNMEIRDRKYDPDVWSLRGHYQISDSEFDLRQFGLFLSNDTLFITFHLNTMVNIFGRRITAGDVIEVLNQRDDLVAGTVAAISKYYVVQEGTRPAEGYGPSWWPHLWRVKCNPITDTQEYKDIMNAPILDSLGNEVLDPSGNVATVGSELSTRGAELAINDKILDLAAEAVPFRNLQGAQFYVLLGDLDKPVTIWAGDGIPPNQSKPVAQGITWPGMPKVGDYFLRIDYSPALLYKRTTDRWVRIETNWRAPWLPANRLLATFINNDAITTLTDGTQQPEKQNLRDVITPRLDPDII